MIYLLDTDTCIPYLNGSDTGVRDRLLALAPTDVALCSVVKAELLFGARNSGQAARNLRRLEAFFAAFQSLPFDDHAADLYGTVRASLARAGKAIGSNDLMIASIALAADATLVTRNTKEFSRVAGLRVDAW